jgi:hypothetical protein
MSTLFQALLDEDLNLAHELFYEQHKRLTICMIEKLVLRTRSWYPDPDEPLNAQAKLFCDMLRVQCSEEASEFEGVATLAILDKNDYDADLHVMLCRHIACEGSVLGRMLFMRFIVLWKLSSGFLMFTNIVSVRDFMSHCLQTLQAVLQSDTISNDLVFKIEEYELFETYFKRRIPTFSQLQMDNFMLVKFELYDQAALLYYVPCQVFSKVPVTKTMVEALCRCCQRNNMVSRTDVVEAMFRFLTEDQLLAIIPEMCRRNMLYVEDYAYAAAHHYFRAFRSICENQLTKPIFFALYTNQKDNIFAMMAKSGNVAMFDVACSIFADQFQQFYQTPDNDGFWFQDVVLFCVRAQHWEMITSFINRGFLGLRFDFPQCDALHALICAPTGIYHQTLIAALPRLNVAVIGLIQSYEQLSSYDIRNNRKPLNLALFGKND